MTKLISETDEEAKKNQDKPFLGSTCSFFKKSGCALGSGLFLGGLAVLMLLPTGIGTCVLFGAGWMFFQIGLQVGYFFADERSYPPRHYSRKLAV